MSFRQQRTENDDAVRHAFREHGPYPRRWSLSDEDLEAYLDADYDTSDGSESVESVEPCETDPLLAAGDRTTLTASSYNTPIRSRVLESYYLVLEPRQRRRRSPRSNIVELMCVGLSWIVFILVLLGIIYLGSPQLRAIIFPDEQKNTLQVKSVSFVYHPLHPPLILSNFPHLLICPVRSAKTHCDSEHHEKMVKKLWMKLPVDLKLQS